MKSLLFLIAGIFCATSAQAQNYPAPIQALVARGITIKGEMQAPEGFKGYVGEFSGQLTPVYLLPDGHHVTIGVLYDEHGKDLTNAAFRAATMAKLDPALWQQLDQSTWIAEGTSKPERIVYVFTDTECPYCHKLWLAVQPYLQQGKVQMRNIIVAVIAPASLGRGAAVLTADDPAATMRRHEQAFGHSPIKPLASVDPKIRAKIEANEVLMNRVNAFATPAIINRDAHGRIHMILGLPDTATMQVIFGNR
ncbi:MAG TPA: thiol:disulfide interchange protein DsbG [Gammaproteobacteria bacterium]|nr:thiol:disulfide interchange protein DsbG [Gammaproteobacteria bacterium]